MALNKPKASSPPSAKKGLKQGSLFSFFNKKAKTSSPSSKSPAAVANSTSTPSNEPPSKKTPASNQLWEKVSVGSRLLVYWKDDDKFYPAKVTGQNRKSKSMFTLAYEDGEVETLDLAMEEFKIVTNKRDSSVDRASTEPPAKKRRQIQEDSDDDVEFDDLAEDDGSVYQDQDDEDDEEEVAQWMVSDDDEDDETPAEEEPETKPKKKKMKKFKVTNVVKPPATPSTKSGKNQFSAFATPPPATASKNGSNTVTPIQLKRVTPSPTKSDRKSAGPLPYAKDVVNPAGSHVHNHLRFLQNPKDAKGHPPDHPEYDSHTLKIDYRELEKHQKCTNAVKQWWQLKAQYFDAVLLFKTGKFYELFHMDADIGVQVLDFCYMKGAVAHAGFPEVSYGIMASKLVRAGYKVARVEQTETPDMLKARKKNKKRGEPTPQVVNREVCSILTLGTRTFCHLDDVRGLVQEATTPGSIGPLLAIREVLMESDDGTDDVQAVCEYGITLVDAVRATITLGQFADDVLRSRMNTLLTAFEPSEILLQGGKDGCSETLRSLIRAVQASSRNTLRVETIQEEQSFPKSTAIDANIRRKMERKSGTVKPWDTNETLDEIHRRGYFPRGSRQQDTKSISRWPKVLQAVVQGNASHALSSLGAALFYLQRNLIDHEILSMGNVQAYVPPASSRPAPDQNEQLSLLDAVPPMTPMAPAEKHVEFDSRSDSAAEREVNHMALDGTTLRNLEVLTNSRTHTHAGSLWSKINYTKTPHGSRLLRAWLLRPLFRKADIERRADAVEELVSGAAAVAVDEARGVLAKCGDIERLLSRIHSMGADPTSDKVHPNERAILYENVAITKRKVGDFSKVLSGLRQASQIPGIFEGIDIHSGLLKKIVQPIDQGGCFPELTQELDWFFDNFDCELAAKGLFEPSRGVDESYDDACDALVQIRGELDEYKDEICSQLGHAARSAWKYVNIKEESKDKYLIELPASVRVPEDFIVKGKRGKGAKQVNKYRTPVVEELVQQLEKALDIKKEGKTRGMELIFAKFDSKRNLWAAAAQTTAMLDAVGSLAQASSGPSFCRPEILECPPGCSPCVNITQGRHPCVEITHNGGEFIPNDLSLGEGSGGDNRSERVLLLSGPNMGGKSTLLRQTCLIAILAQMGCYVPADSCRLTPIDRIFTRLGASDRILMGQSTFFVELAETASALRGATRRSLVIMDELGRGTSTFDGTAIASACVKHLVESNKCLALFATHYHSLLREWMKDETVRLGHMQCYVEGGVDDQEAEKDHNITFLYTLGDGACPASFGINVAKLAGLPNEVLTNAKEKSTSFELEMTGTQNAVPQDVVRKLCDAAQSDDLDAIGCLWKSLR